MRLTPTSLGAAAAPLVVGLSLGLLGPAAPARPLAGSPVPGPSAGPVAGPEPSAVAPASAPRRLTGVYTTGYTWADNTPPGSGAISHPVRHAGAGGTGTAADPVTVAVGHRRAGRRDVLDLPAGTRLYLPHLRRYGVVEDTCGDGPTPQDRPCHDLRLAPRGARLWIDVYVGGGPHDAGAGVRRCAGEVTDGDGHALHAVVLDPPRGLPVRPGPLWDGSRCRALR